jgi:peptidyl-prolyl cis-trans isomerase A (cyclophilin A)
MTVERLLAAGVLAVGLQAPAAPVRVQFETEAGAFVVEVDAARAPRTAANFLRYVDAGLYDGGRFHRAVRPDNETRPDVPIQVIQAAMSRAKVIERMAAIPLERTGATGLKHADGTISMARSEAADSARDEFFICIGDQPALDEGGKRSRDGQGFAAFGRVISGMDVVKKIHAAPSRGQTLSPVVLILKARRIS